MYIYIDRYHKIPGNMHYQLKNCWRGAGRAGPAGPKKKKNGIIMKKNICRRLLLYVYIPGTGIKQ